MPDDPRNLPDPAAPFLQFEGPHLAQLEGTVQAAFPRRLSPCLRPQYDPADLVQEVWVAFFTRMREGHLSNPGAIHQYLAVIARNKHCEVLRRRGGQKRDAGREQGDASVAKRAPARNPTPADEVATRDQWDNLLKRLSVRDRSVLERLRDGCTHAEAASCCRVSTRTIDRLLDRLRSANAASNDARSSPLRQSGAKGS